MLLCPTTSGADRRRKLPGRDSRGLERYEALDGTNLVEAYNGEMEKTFSSNGGYNAGHSQGMMMASASRISIKGICRK